MTKLTDSYKNALRKLHDLDELSLILSKIAETLLQLNIYKVNDYKEILKYH